MMDIEKRDDRVMALAAEALSRLSGDRDRFLQLACQNDPGLYHDVSEVVSWEERMCGFLCQPLIDFVDIENLDRPFKPSQLVAGRYEIIREVGEGGMGVVYEANDLKLEHRIAIKCPKLGYDRLPPELRSALKVRHRNICLVNDIHKVKVDLGELEFLTMEFLDGETLLSRLGRGRLESAEALQIARQLCAGLSEAHHRGVLHRDLKPANVILSEENKQLRVVITDFGLAADQAANTDLLGGTASYMAPEMKEQRQTSTASDVYALGVILYEMVTGQRPFQEAIRSNGNVLAPIAPGKLVRHLPRIWNDAILPCLAPHPANRPSVEEVLAVLNRPPLYRRPWVAVAAVLVLVTAGTFLWRPVYEYCRLPDITLVILPIQGTGNVSRLGGSILHDVTEHLSREPKHQPKFLLIPPEVAISKNVATLEQAQSLLHATHALQLALHRDNTGVAVDADVVYLKTQTRLRHYSGHFTEAELVDLPGGLAGAVTSVLHLKRLSPESISPDATVAFQAGRNYLREGRYSFDQAIAQFQQASRQDVHSPLPFAGLVEAYVFKYRGQSDRNDLEQADAYLKTAEKLDPDSPNVRLASAWLNIFRNKYPQATEDCSRVLEVAPGNSQAWMLCGFIYDLQGNNKALEYLNQAVALDPTYFRPHQFLGGYYYTHGRFVEAEQQYKEEVKYALDDRDGYSDLGDVLTAQGKYEEAEQVYEKALSLKVTPAVLNNLGVNEAYMGQDTKALPYYQKAVALEESNFIYWINMGDAERRLGHLKDANSSYLQGLALTSAHLDVNADSYLTRAYKAYTQARLGRKADARHEIDQAIQSPDEDQQLLLYAMLTYEVLGDRGQALKLVSRLNPQMKIMLQHHPDLADLSRDLRSI